MVGDVLVYSVVATFIVSLFSFVGVFTLGLKEKRLKKILLLLVAFSAGALMGGAFLHLLPESIELESGCAPFIFVLVGFSLFFLNSHRLDNNLSLLKEYKETTGLVFLKKIKEGG